MTPLLKQKTHLANCPLSSLNQILTNKLYNNALFICTLKIRF